MDYLFFLLLRLVHILAGLFWVGAAVMMAGFIEPVAREAGPAGGRFMQGLVQQRRLPLYFTISALLTILSGLALYWRASAGLQWSWVLSGPGLAFTIGAVAAIVAAVLGQVINAPTAVKIGAVGAQMQAAGGPPSAALVAQMQALQAQLRLAVRVVAVLLVIAAASMAVARYIA